MCVLMLFQCGGPGEEDHGFTLIKIGFQCSGLPARDNDGKCASSI